MLDPPVTDVWLLLHFPALLELVVMRDWEGRLRRILTEV